MNPDNEVGIRIRSIRYPGVSEVASSVARAATAERAVLLALEAVVGEGATDIEAVTTDAQGVLVRFDGRTFRLSMREAP